MPYNIEDELKMLDPKKVHFQKDKYNRIKMTIDGEIEYSEVRPVMSSPLSSPETYVSFYEIKDDKKDKEIGIIDDINKLDSESKKLIKEELKKEYFMPQIIRINSMNESHGVMKFDVETDKGRRIFETRYKEDIRKLIGGRIIIRDADGNRYEISDFRKLDQRSMNLIDTEI
ncbi:TPA: DUF1854 domain-containing protein [bacterium]|nr:DUF1854 domain-containing protein [bacterium]